MTRFSSRWQFAALVLCLVVVGAGSAATVRAESPVKLRKSIIMCDPSLPLSPLTIEGNASHLGKFTAEGEISFRPSETENLLIGEGVVVFTAANGDLIVGVITLEIAPFVNNEADVHIHIAWRDFVKFADGSVVPNTGRFVRSRPPGVSTRGTGSHVWISIPLCIVTR